MERPDRVVDIARRMTGLTDDDLGVLASVSEATTGWGPTIAKAFYAHLFSEPDSAELLKGQDRDERVAQLTAWYNHVALPEQLLDGQTRAEKLAN